MSDRLPRDGQNTAPSPGELRYRERCLEKLGFAFQGDERVLDVGCGDGGVSRLLRARVREVVAVDLEANPAWEDGSGLSFIVADGERLPFDARSFDLVHSKDSLHHMNRPADALREYRRVLRPGGHALILEANRYNPSFYFHMTRQLGHAHFTTKRFRGLVSEVFADAQFGSFEAHYVPFADRLLRLQDLVESALDRMPLFPRSYNFASATT
jgi:ubiquinone/menaquinone biosynthesis C-methylase UbiE